MSGRNVNYKLLFTIASVTAILLGLNACSKAITCNRRAQSHQARARNIYMMTTEFHHIPSQEDEKFLLCMLEEREDKDAFQRRVRELKDEKRNADDLEARRRAEAAEQQRRDQQLANQLAQEQAAREAQAEHRVVFIEGTGGNYYLGLVGSDDVVIVEPLQGRYASVGLHVGDYAPREPYNTPGKKIPPGQMGSVGVEFDTADPIRLNVRQADRSLPPNRLGHAKLKFASSDNMQIRVTILCVSEVKNIPCKDR